jgi:hypothetical protein
LQVTDYHRGEFGHGIFALKASGATFCGSG